MRSDILADFVATGSNAGPKGGIDIGRSGIEILVHLMDGMGDECGCRAAPTSMDGGNCSISGIEQQDGDTIGCADTDGAMDIVRNERVTFTLAVSEAGSI